MTIHWITLSSQKADTWPFAEELRRLDSTICFFTGQVRLRYRRKLFLVLFGYPRLFIFSLRSAIRSLTAKDRPSVSVLESDVALISYRLTQVALGRRNIKTVLSSFIFIPHRNPIIDRLKRFYYRQVLKLVDIIIVHSAREIDANRQRFTKAAEKFVHVPYGIGAPREKLDYVDQPLSGFILSAGRSARDYRTLIEAVEGTSFILVIICDSIEALPDSWLSDQVKVERRCYEGDYIDKMFEAELVCVPLDVEEASAGQMVFLHAMAYRKPIIVTDTPTVREYIHSDDCVVLVPPKDPVSLRRAIEELMASSQRRRELATNAGSNFERHHTVEQMARAMYGAIRDNLYT